MPKYQEPSSIHRYIYQPSKVVCCLDDPWSKDSQSYQGEKFGELGLTGCIDIYIYTCIYSHTWQGPFGIMRMCMDTVDNYKGPSHIYLYTSRWWIQIFFMFIPTWGNDPI